MGDCHAARVTALVEKGARRFRRTTLLRHISFVLVAAGSVAIWEIILSLLDL
jgi:hypothetical protein